MAKNNINMRMLLGLTAAFIFNAFLPARAQSAQKVYSTYCSGCHGAKLEGSVATALIKKEWKHGGDKPSLVKTISKGVPSTEMISWESVLTKEQIDELASFIVSAQTCLIW